MTRQEAEEKAYTLVTRGVAQRTKILLVADELMAAFERGKEAEAKTWAKGLTNG